MTEVVCPNCKASAPVGAVFCDNCGYNLSNIAPSAQVPVTPQYPAPPQYPGAPQYSGTPAAASAACNSCGHVNVPGAAFCENCGSSLAAYPAAPAVPAQPPVWTPPAQPPAVPVAPPVLTGRLVVQGSNATINFPPGKAAIFIGREDPVSNIFPEIDLDPHGGQDAGVGRKHARLFVQGAQVMIEDLNSVNGSSVNKVKLVPGQPAPVHEGDELRFGKLYLIYHSS